MLPLWIKQAMDCCNNTCCKPFEFIEEFSSSNDTHGL